MIDILHDDNTQYAGRSLAIELHVARGDIPLLELVAGLAVGGEGDCDVCLGVFHIGSTVSYSYPVAADGQDGSGLGVGSIVIADAGLFAALDICSFLGHSPVAPVVTGRCNYGVCLWQPDSRPMGF